MQHLCHRRVLATLTVTTLDGGDDHTDGLVSLYEATQAARFNAAYGDALAGSALAADTIVFDPALAGGTIELETTLLLEGDTSIDAASVGGVTLRPTSDRAIASIINSSTNDFGFRNLNLENGNHAILGGAIQVHSANSVLLKEVTIRDSSGAVGGAIWVNDSDLIVRDSHFIGNDASIDGGAIYQQAGTLTVARSTFEGNSAGIKGGAIHSLADSILIVDSNIGAVGSGNTAGTAGLSDGLGGGIHASENGKLTVRGSTIAGNTVHGAGGGIATHGRDVMLRDSVIQANESQGEDGPYAEEGSAGGVFVDEGSLKIRDTDFLDNIADGNGGAIGSRTVADIRRASFVGNSARYRGGGIWHRDSFAEETLTVVDSVFTANIVDPMVAHAPPVNGGGAIYLSSDAVIENSDFFDNTAVTRGGAIHADGGPQSSESLSITGSQFAGNAAAYGGALAASDFDIESVDSVFENNVAESGGAINASGRDGYLASLLMINNTLESNHSLGDGGALLLSWADGEVIDSVFAENSADDDGGAVAVKSGSEIHLDESRLENNSAAGDGGAIAHFDGLLFLTDTELTGNTSEGDGGGLAGLGSDATATVLRSSFMDHSSVSGYGDAMFWEGGTVFMTDCEFDNQGAAGSDVTIAASSGIVTVGSSVFVDHGAANITLLGTDQDDEFIINGDMMMINDSATVHTSGSTVPSVQVNGFDGSDILHVTPSLSTRYGFDGGDGPFDLVLFDITVAVVTNHVDPEWVEFLDHLGITMVNTDLSLGYAFP